MKAFHIIALAIILDIVLVDQLSKWWITEYILRPETGGEAVGLFSWIAGAPERVGFASVPVLPHFNLSMVWNEGVSFGMLNGLGIWALAGLTVLICTILLYLLVRSETKIEAFSYSIIIGGALGNLVDRFRFGGVADFLDVYVGTYHWPAFNVADACISIGVALLLIQGIFMSSNNSE